jgi:hypothetical protein
MPRDREVRGWARGERKGQARRHNAQALCLVERGDPRARAVPRAFPASGGLHGPCPAGGTHNGHYAYRRAQRRAWTAARGGEHGAGRAYECRG